jgi:Na+-transporting methylmalonyl-CoA/oxaloacetate decarboxylase gamma subunit
MSVNIVNLYASLEIMFKGMIGLFIVCIFIAVVIKFISKLMATKISHYHNTR